MVSRDMVSDVKYRRLEVDVLNESSSTQAVKANVSNASRYSMICLFFIIFGMYGIVDGTIRHNK